MASTSCSETRCAGPTRTDMEIDYFKYEDGNVDIYRKVRGNWVLWLIVRDSVALASVGARGKGLFAAHCAFEAGDYVGRYIGRVLGKAKDVNTQRRVNSLSRTLQGDAVIVINNYFVDGRRPLQSDNEQHARFNKVVIKSHNTYRWPGIYAHIANDAHGTRFSNNCIVTPGGYMHILEGCSVPRYDFLRPHLENAACELLWSYGDHYWRSNARLGTSAAPVTVERRSSSSASGSSS